MSSKVSPQDFYNKFAPNYDSVLQGNQVDAQYVNEANRLFHKYHRGTNGSILDIGCGTGLLKELLEGDFEYTGVDVAENMLHYASNRGYKIIHKSIEDALPEIPDSSFDFIFALGSLLFIQDIHSSLEHMNRIARQSIVLSLDSLSEKFIDSSKIAVFDHSKISIPEAEDDYFIRGWTSPTTGITIKVRMVYISMKSGQKCKI